MPHISIKAEPIFKLFGLSITNSMITFLISLLIFFLIAVYYKKQINLPYNKKSKLFYLFHYLNNVLYNLFKTVFKDKVEVFFPLLAIFFIYILIQNWFGLIPGVESILFKGIPLLRGNTADLNTTFALALISVVLVQYYGIKFLGFKNYIKKFIDLSSPIALFTGLLEIISEISKVISFAFRLFGNIFAGEVLLAIMGFLVPILISFPFLMLEVFVGLIQALVFSMLTAVFIEVAITEHH